MKFGLIQEAVTPIGVTHHRRYMEVIREVQAAEQAGFDFWGCSEQHFVAPQATVSAPEVLFGAVAALTNTIRIRHMIVLMPFNFNHPIRVAERIATLDIVSNGRAELGMGRANTFVQLEGFGVDPKEARAEMLEGIDVVAKALSQETFSHEGPKLSIPPRRLSPRAVQVPHPPFYAACTSMEMAEICGQKGIGLMFGDTGLGWEYMAEGLESYRKGISQTQPVSGHLNDSMGFISFSVCCRKTREEAKEVGGNDALQFLRGVSHVYTELSKKSDDYAYMAQIKRLKQYGKDLDYLMEATPSILLGTPDDLIERCKQLEKLGVQEVIWRIENDEHEETLKSLELIGRYVIPEFKTPGAVTREMGVLPGTVP